MTGRSRGASSPRTLRARTMGDGVPHRRPGSPGVSSMDLTVVAVPFYFGSMGVEHKVLARRAAVDGPSAGDYAKDDQIASLTMGPASRVAPFVAKAFADRVRIGRGKPGAKILGAAPATAAAVAV